jgi:hypothetical protein
MTFTTKEDRFIPMIKSRVLEYIDYKGFTKKFFFNKTDISLSSFKGIGLKSELSADKIVNILTCFEEINCEWLLLGKGDMLKSTYNDIVEEKETTITVEEPVVSYQANNQSSDINKYLENKVRELEHECRTVMCENAVLKHKIESIKDE